MKAPPVFENNLGVKILEPIPSQKGATKKASFLASFI